MLLLHLLPLTLEALRLYFSYLCWGTHFLMHCFLYDLIMNLVLSICDLQKWLSWSQLYILIFPNKGTSVTIDLRFPGEWICLYARFFISMSFPYTHKCIIKCDFKESPPKKKKSSYPWHSLSWMFLFFLKCLTTFRNKTDHHSFAPLCVISQALSMQWHHWYILSSTSHSSLQYQTSKLLRWKTKIKISTFLSHFFLRVLTSACPYAGSCLRTHWRDEKPK